MSKVKDDLVTIDEALILAGGTNRWSNKQLKLLGVTPWWPHPPKGWKERIIGTQITRAAAERFVELRSGAPPKSRPLFELLPDGSIKRS
jgi:hypothetical protein